MKKNAEVYTVEEAAKLLGIGRNLAYAGVNSGQIPNFRIGNSIKIPKVAFDKWLSERPKAQHPNPVEILKVSALIRTKPKIAKIAVNISISVELNNRLVRAAVDNGATLSGEITRRLEDTFRRDEKAGGLES